MRRWLLLSLVWLHACSGPPLPEAFVVSDLRVIAMVAEPSQVVPTGQTHITAYLFDPDNAGRTVSVKFYQCDDRGASEGTVGCLIDGMSPTTTLLEVAATAIGTDLFAASFDFAPAPGLLADKGALAQRYGYDEIIAVRGDNGLRHIDGYKRVTVKPAATTVFNKNPVLDGFNLQLNSQSIGDDTSVDGVVRGTAYVVTPLFDPMSAETYDVVDFTGVTQTLTEEMSFSWSCSPACTISQRISYAGDLVTITTPDKGAESGRFTVQLVMRDGRGGEAIHVRTFALLPQTRVY